MVQIFLNFQFSPTKKRYLAIKTKYRFFLLYSQIRSIILMQRKNGGTKNEAITSCQYKQITKRTLHDTGAVSVSLGCYLRFCFKMGAWRSDTGIKSDCSCVIECSFRNLLIFAGSDNFIFLYLRFSLHLYYATYL